MAAGSSFWSCALGFGKDRSPLDADLRRVTDLAFIDTPPKDAMFSVMQASNTVSGRRDILKHLQECLADTSGAHWRRVHGGLVLLDELLKRGSPLLAQEIAKGMHFDPVQRLSFLEKYEYSTDRRVQAMIQQKASTLRSTLLSRLESAHDDGPVLRQQPQHPGGARCGAASSGFVGFGSDDVTNSTGATSATSSTYVGFGGEDLATSFYSDRVASKKNLVNGLVSVGHRDDTDSEGSDVDNEGPSLPRGGAKPAKRSEGAAVGRSVAAALPNGRRRNPLEDSTDSESEGDQRSSRRHLIQQQQQQSPPAGAFHAAATPPPPPAVDLLGTEDPPPPRPPEPPRGGDSSPPDLNLLADDFGCAAQNLASPWAAPDLMEDVVLNGGFGASPKTGETAATLLAAPPLASKPPAPQLSPAPMDDLAGDFESQAARTETKTSNAGTDLLDF